MEELKNRFPANDLDYRIVYDTTVFVQESVPSLQDADRGVHPRLIVVLVFLQDWRPRSFVIDVIVSSWDFLRHVLLGFS